MDGQERQSLAVSNRRSHVFIISYPSISEKRRRCAGNRQSEVTKVLLRFPQVLIETRLTIEDDRRALEAEGGIKIRKIEVDYDRFEVNEESHDRQ